MTEEAKTYEDVLDALGRMGRYQKLVFVQIICLVFALSSQCKFMIFGGIIPKSIVCPLWAMNADASNQTYGIINLTVKESMWQDDIVVLKSSVEENLTCYDIKNMPYYSISPEWQLLGSNLFIVHMITSLQMVGIFTGPLVGGFLADRFGRKPLILGSLMMLLLFGGAAGFCTSWQMFAAVRLCIGFASGSALSTGFVFTAENLLGSWRVALNSLPWPLNYFFFVSTAWLTRHWRIHSYVITLPAVVAIVLGLFLMESPKWLLARGRTAEARKAILKIGRINKIPKDKLDLILNLSTDFNEIVVDAKTDKAAQEDCIAVANLNNSDPEIICLAKGKLNYMDRLLNETCGSENTEDTRYENSSQLLQRNKPSIVTYSYIHLFTAIRPSVQCLTLIFCNIVITANYNSILFNAGNLTSDPYLITMILAVTEVSLNFVATTIDYKFATVGRRIMLIVGLLAVTVADVAIAIILSLGLPVSLNYIPAIPSILCLSLTVFFWVGSVMMSVEMFPTELRNMGTSLCQIGARIGAVLGPQLFTLNKFWPSSSYVISICLLTVAAVLAVFILPETKGQPLPDLPDCVKESVAAPRESHETNQ